MNTLFPLLIFWYIKLLNIIYDERPREQNPIFVIGGGGRGDSDMKIACKISTKKGRGRRYWFDRQLKMDTDALITFVKPRFSTCIT